MNVPKVAKLSLSLVPEHKACLWGLDPSEPPPPGPAGGAAPKELAPEGPGCWLRSGWEGSFNDTQHKTQGGKKRGG